MRISCPNCAAQYEVSQDAIPEAGRDVQCAKCSEVWFQPRVAPAPLTLDSPLSVSEAPQEDPTPQAEQTPTFRSARGDREADFRQVLREEAAYATEAASPAASESVETAFQNDVSATEAQADQLSQVIAQNLAEAQPPVSEPEAPPAQEAQPEQAPRSLRDLMDQQFSKEVKHADAPAAAEPPSPAFKKLSAESTPAPTAAPAAAPEAAKTMADLASVTPAAAPQQRKPLDPADVFADIDKLNSSLEQEGAIQTQTGGATSAGIDERLALGDRAFNQGMSAAFVISALSLGFYMISPILAGTFDGAAPFVNAVDGAVDGMRLRVQDLYYQGGEPGFNNFLRNLLG